MYRIFFICFLFLVFQTQAFEDVPMFPQDSGINILYVQNPDYEINVDKMRKSDKIKEAQDLNNTDKNRKINFETRQINHQRALDFTTNQVNSTMLPRF